MPKTANAQPSTGAGCMSRDGFRTVYQAYTGMGGLPFLARYQPQTGGRYSQWGPKDDWIGDETHYPCVKWIPNGTLNCYYRSTIGSGIYLRGDLGSFTGNEFTTCALDDDATWLILPLCVIGCFFVRKTKK